MLTISAVKSNEGKTHVSCALSFVLCKLGLRFKVFKTGPDYLDTAYASQFSNFPSTNLVSYNMRKLSALRSRSNICSLVEDCMGA